MSKRFIALLLLATTIVCSSIFIYYSNTIQHPIPIPQSESILSIEGGENQFLNIAYVDNRLNHRELERITIGERSFYPWDPLFESTSTSSTVDYTYYSLYETRFSMTEDDVSYFKENPELLKHVTFHFSQLGPQTAPLSFLEPFEQSILTPVRTITTEGAGTLVFDIKDVAPITISTIKSPSPFIKFTATVDDKEITLPTTLNEGSSLKIDVQNLYNFTQAQQLQLLIAGYDQNKSPFLRTQILDSYGYPSEKVMRQFVKEWRDSK